MKDSMEALGDLGRHEGVSYVGHHHNGVNSDEPAGPTAGASAAAAAAARASAAAAAAATTADINMAGIMPMPYGHDHDGTSDGADAAAAGAASFAAAPAGLRYIHHDGSGENVNEGTDGGAAIDLRPVAQGADGNAFANTDTADVPMDSSPIRMAAAFLTATDKPTGKDFRGGQPGWQASLYQFLLFRARNGAAAIPKANGGTHEKQLHLWVQNQKRHAKLMKVGEKSSMTADRLAVLEDINFPFHFRGEAHWKKNYEALKRFKADKGHCLVPRGYAENPKLGEWVVDQRRQYKFIHEGKPSLLTDDRKAKLDALGFTWQVRERMDWNKRYQQLVEYKNKHGNTIVPQNYAKNKPLGKWTAKQREQYRFRVEGKHSFLTGERIEKLNDIGFVWAIKGRYKKENYGKYPFPEQQQQQQSQPQQQPQQEQQQQQQQQQQEKEGFGDPSTAAVADPVPMPPFQQEHMGYAAASPPLGASADPPEPMPQMLQPGPSPIQVHEPHPSDHDGREEEVHGV